MSAKEFWMKKSGHQKAKIKGKKKEREGGGDSNALNAQPRPMKIADELIKDNWKSMDSPGTATGILGANWL